MCVARQFLVENWVSKSDSWAGYKKNKVQIENNYFAFAWWIQLKYKKKKNLFFKGQDNYLSLWCYWCPCFYLHAYHIYIYIRLSSHLSQTKVDDFIRSDILYNKLSPFQFRSYSKILFLLSISSSHICVRCHLFSLSIDHQWTPTIVFFFLFCYDTI
jgi:hypothetical protein